MFCNRILELENPTKLNLEMIIFIFDMNAEDILW